MKELVWAKLWLGRKKHDDTYLTYIMLFAKDGCVYDPESIICQRNIRRPRLIDSTRGTSSAGTRRATRSRHAILIPSHRSSSMRRASLEPGGHRSSCPPPPPHRTLGRSMHCARPVHRESRRRRRRRGMDDGEAGNRERIFFLPSLSVRAGAWTANEETRHNHKRVFRTRERLFSSRPSFSFFACSCSRRLG